MTSPDGRRPGGPARSGRPGPAPSLSPGQIAAAAVGLADAHGLPAVTMRSVATALGVSAPGLYRYVASREELVGHMVDTVSAGLRLPEPSGNWAADFLAVAEQQRALFRAHPWLSDAVASLRVMGRHVLDYLDWGLAALADVDAPATRKMEAIALSNGIAALFASSSAPVGAEAFTQLDPHRHPRLTALLTSAVPSAASADLFATVHAGVLRALLAPDGPHNGN